MCKVVNCVFKIFLGRKVTPFMPVPLKTVNRVQQMLPNALRTRRQCQCNRRPHLHKWVFIISSMCAKVQCSTVVLSYLHTLTEIVLRCIFSASCSLSVNLARYNLHWKPVKVAWISVDQSPSTIVPSQVGVARREVENEHTRDARSQIYVICLWVNVGRRILLSGSSMTQSMVLLLKKRLVILWDSFQVITIVLGSVALDDEWSK